MSMSEGPVRHTDCRCTVVPITDVDELAVAFGALLLHEPDMTADLILLADLFADAGD